MPSLSVLRDAIRAIFASAFAASAAAAIIFAIFFTVASVLTAAIAIQHGRAQVDSSPLFLSLAMVIFSLPVIFLASLFITLPASAAAIACLYPAVTWFRAAPRFALPFIGLLSGTATLLCFAGLTGLLIDRNASAAAALGASVVFGGLPGCAGGTAFAKHLGIADFWYELERCIRCAIKNRADCAARLR